MQKGQGRFLVTSVGLRTEAGRIRALVLGLGHLLREKGEEKSKGDEGVTEAEKKAAEKEAAEEEDEEEASPLTVGPV